jgi:hypothetical protein
MVQDKIKQYFNYFKGLSVENNTIILQLILKPNWRQLEIGSPENIKVSQDDANPNLYYIFGLLDKTNVDEIMDYGETLIQTNIELEKKKELFEAKKNELIQIFNDKNIDELRSLKISLDCHNKGGDCLKMQPKKQLTKSSRPKKEPVIETENSPKNELTKNKEESIIISGNDVDKLDL